MSQVIGKERCPECAKRGKDTKGDNLVSYSDGHSYCYGCGYTLNSSASKLSNFVSNSSQPPFVADQVWLPHDCSFDYSSIALEWVGQYDLDKNTLLRNRVMWSPSKERLCFPVIGGNGEYLAYTGRNFNPTDSRSKWVSYGDLDNTFHIKGNNNKTLVLVEDIVSAIKVSSITQSMPLFGNHIGLKRWKRLYQLTPRGSTINIWLDPDMKTKAIKERALGASVGLNTRVIFSDKDPKEHSYDEIEELIVTL